MSTKKAKYSVSGKLMSEIFSFFLCLILQLYLNSKIPVMRSLPDELGAVALAAKSVGYDWTYVLTHPTMYYGSASFPFVYPFFRLIKDPIILYQCLLAVGASLRTIPCIICIEMMYRFFNIKCEIYLFVSGLIAVFIMPTRASNFDNEPILILICWMIIYTLGVLLKMPDKRIQKKYSCILALLLGYSMLAHTRALVYVIALIGVCILYYFSLGKQLINFKFFVPCFTLMYVVDQVIINWVIKNIYTFTETVENIANTSDSLFRTIFSHIKRMIEPYGIQSFFDILCGNIWVVFVFGCGMVVIFFISILYSIRFEKRLIDYIGLYGVLGLTIIMGGVCINWLDSAINVHVSQANISRGHFYLRYYSLFFPPIIFWGLVTIYRHWDILRRPMRWTIGCVYLCVKWCLMSFIPKDNLGKKNSDWFYYFMPLSGKIKEWPNAIQNYAYYMCSTLTALCICIILFRLIKTKKIYIAISVYACMLIYQYWFGCYYFDRPFSESDNYEKAANAIYECRSENTEIWENIEEVTYINDTYGPQYILQFILLDKKVILEYPDADSSEAIIITNNLSQIDYKSIKAEEYRTVKLDDNEILLIKGESLANKFTEAGYILEGLQ